MVRRASEVQLRHFGRGVRLMEAGPTHLRNMVRGKEKSNASLRRDPSWKYSVQVDIGGAEKTYVYLKCNFCDKVVKGGVTRMKEHLSSSHKNVAPCANVPDKVKEEISAYMKKSTTAKHLQQEQFDDRVEHGSYYGSESGKGSSSTIHSRGARGPMDQYMVNPGEDRGQTQMMPAAEQSIEEIKRTWSETGVTIMSDGWSDMKSRSLINVLVNNPYGTVFLRSIEASDEIKNADFIFNLLDGVVEEIGEQLVVQVVTDNASAYKAAGHMLMEKRKHLYWTPCAAHYIDLILEQLGDLPQHKNALSKAKKITKFIYNHSWVLALMRKFSKKEIIRPATTRFATSYLTLQSILDVRQPLEAMFTSTQWLNSAWGKKPEGKEVRRHILNDKFWASVTYAILSTRPLVQVLHLVDAEKKPAMSFIYNVMDETKELIAHNLGGEEASYREIWDIIDARWEVQLHRHLHAAAYYLNPQFQYSERKSSNPELNGGSNLVIPLLSYRVLPLEFWASLVLPLGVSETGARIVRRLRNNGLKDDEDPLVCEDVAFDNEWFIDDETDLPLSDLQLEDLSVDVLRGEADQGGKRKVGNIEDDEDLTFIDTIGEEDSLEDPFSDGT
ncbi:hypothetical protein M5K25_024931 [Dendrobium thyrsiflorum]|uniref:BED-type domain-containing protein n=1 Tax=Dendrobium thyrsiflorum TaxID=117978 RepID=A0ABD0U3B8_DENTH